MCSNRAVRSRFQACTHPGERVDSVAFMAVRSPKLTDDPAIDEQVPKTRPVPGTPPGFGRQDATNKEAQPLFDVQQLFGVPVPMCVNSRSAHTRGLRPILRDVGVR